MRHLIEWGTESLGFLAIAVLPALAIWAFLTWRRSRASGLAVAAGSAAIDVGLLLSIALIAIVGLRPGLGVPGGFEQWNLVPFRDLARAIDGRPWGFDEAAAGVIANAVVFAPFGFFYALRFREASFLRAVAIAAAMSLGIEIWQATVPTGRSSDVTDVITNTAGGAIGFVIGRGLQAIGSRLGGGLTRRAGEQHASANSTEAPIP